MSIAGQSLSGLDEDARAAIRGRHLGFVFQNFQLLLGLTALDNIRFPLELKGHDAVEETARDCLERVGLQHRSQHYPKQLSGGEQQRLAIARALAFTPKILFADEPTGNLDMQNQASVTDVLFSLNQTTQTTLILVTHSQTLADHCDRILYLEHGRLRS